MRGAKNSNQIGSWGNQFGCCFGSRGAYFGGGVGKFGMTAPLMMIRFDVDPLINLTLERTDYIIHMNTATHTSI